MEWNIWTASREEQLSSDILSWEIICFQVTKTCGTQPAAKLLASPCFDGKLGSLRAHPGGSGTCGAEPWTSPRNMLFYGVGGINICPLEGSISYTKSSNFNPFPGIFIFMRLHQLLKILLKCLYETHFKILEAVWSASVPLKRSYA